MQCVIEHMKILLYKIIGNKAILVNIWKKDFFFFFLISREKINWQETTSCIMNKNNSKE